MNFPGLLSSVRALALICLLGPGLTSAVAQTKAAPNLLSSNPASAWIDLERGYTSVRPPASWQTRAPRSVEVTSYQRILRNSALNYAAKAEEFARRFPTNEHVGDARVMCVYFHAHALAAGEEASEQKIADFVQATVADEALPEKHRVAVFLVAGNAPVFKAAGMRYFTEGPQAFEEEIAKQDKLRLKEAKKIFPKSEFVYRFIIGFAQRLQEDEQKEMLAEVLDAPGAPDRMKKLARYVQDGLKLFETGKPVEIKFTSIEGKEVDLASLKGKVVLVTFWSTEDLDSLAEVTKLNETYQKLHDRGLEMIGISLDDKPEAVLRHVKSKGIQWPQYCDGKGWANEFAVRYGVLKLPTTWLVDKYGNLRLTNTPGNVDRLVEFFLVQREKQEGADANTAPPAPNPAPAPAPAPGK